MQDRTFGDDVRIQDIDLLARLNSYFDHLDDRLEHGQGWLIFNSASDRGGRILRLLMARLAEYRPFVSHCHLPWRDFALHAYISGIALPRDAALAEGAAEGSARRREFAIASGVANATTFQLQHADLVILSNLDPATDYETLALSQTAVERTARRRATIALTAHDPWSLSNAFEAADPSGIAWSHFYGAMQASSLIAH